MRLVDADALLNKICKKFDIPKDWDGDIAEPLQTIIDIIDNEPTAYDVEKVVGQLQEREETSKECYVEAMTEGIGCSVNRFCGERFAYNNAIEIVRKGGVE